MVPRAEPKVNLRTMGAGGLFRFSEIMLVGAALAALMAAEAMLCSAILGTNYYGVDGKMEQTTALAVFKFGVPFGINNINPNEGVGSQLLPMNAWANPAYWPFALVGPELAADLSAILALGIFALACYLMARCFDVPVLPSILAAQSTIVLFAPAVLIVHLPSLFCLIPGNAVVFAPHMVALGLLGRVAPGPWRNLALATAGITALLFYSLYCEPLWTLVNGISWALPFAIVTFGALRWRTILARGAVLGFFIALLVLSGAAEYLHTLSQYTARVQFPMVLDRVRGPELVSALSYSPNMKTFYFGCMLGWLIGLVALRGRPRVLVAAGFITFIAWVAYSVVYVMILNKPWIPPIPIYGEQCLIPLYLASAIAGYWGALRVTANWAFRVRSLGAEGAANLSAEHLRRSAFYAVQSLRIAAVRDGIPRLARVMSPLPRSFSVVGTGSLSLAEPGAQAFCGIPGSMLRPIALFLPFALIAIIPGMLVHFSLTDAAPFRRTWYEPWPNEPEVTKLFSDNISQGIGEPFRGSIMLWAPDYLYPKNLTTVNLWARGIPTVNEYSPLVTPQVLYFAHKLFKQDVRGQLNGFHPFFGIYSPSYWAALRLFGVRYFMTFAPLAQAVDAGLTLVTLPHTVVEKEPAVWQIYELAHPNIGDFSPTEIVRADSATETMALLASPNFDFSRQAVIESEIGAPLVPARDMRMLRVRGGVHVSGKSNGTSLVILPQQFTHCFRARNERVRLVRADLMMTGVIFSRDLDTDILFDYGVFSPGCRRADLADVHRLGMTIDTRMPHLVGDRIFPDWDGVKARLGGAMGAIQ